ncbi:MAG TPA: membrane protein insertion efficiency factor YidD [Vicinamibacterales bacterium]|nr:membrane protein insertion efficiency factor YidD [Vicinamibacterales bacterium]
MPPSPEGSPAAHDQAARPGAPAATPDASPAPRRTSWRTARVLAVLAALVSLSAFDAARPPATQWSARIALAGLHEYQRHVSPLLTGLGIRCRFTPTCSRYAEVEIARYGIVIGGWRSLRRVARCGPWTPMGTADPP